MAVSAKLYGLFAQSEILKKLDWDNDTIKVMLCTSSYTPDQDTHDFLDDITNEITGTGYSAGGATLLNKSKTYTAATNTLKLDADDTEWTSSSITARYAIIYDDTPSTNATKPLIGYVDFGANESSVTGSFKLQWSTDGIISKVIS